MNLPNKITLGRFIIAIIILVLLAFPWYEVGVTFPSYLVFSKITIDIKYIIAGGLFLIAAISDFFDGYFARKQNIVTDFGKIMDAIADKVLVNGLLIILACDGFISVVIPVVIITRDIIVDSIKMSAGNNGKVVAASLMGKVKTVCMMSGITLVLFYNLPFEIIGINVADVLVMLAAVLSVISGCQYYMVNKDLIFTEK
jgi:CDP-diacylglycerol--glycerol-3-phosphate 3-phosphatidyltransferase